MSKFDWVDLACMILAIPVFFGVWIGGVLLARHLFVLYWGCAP